MQDVHDRAEAADFDLRKRLFPAFARRRLLQGLLVFHEAGRNGPEAPPWLDGAPAQQDPSVVLRHAARHQFRVFVVDRSAGRADLALQVIAIGDAERDAAPRSWSRSSWPDLYSPPAPPGWWNW